MKAIETIATINDQGQLLLDDPLISTQPRRVRVIVLIPEEDELDPDDTPTEVILEGIRQGWNEAMTGQTYPIEQLWDGIDVDSVRNQSMTGLAKGRGQRAEGEGDRKSPITRRFSRWESFVQIGF
ncbi:hypothetical protein K9N68_12370 [Kovacikia minuta CCNUW1]|uniref:type II toxin-antitoxin system RelN family antitoxin n=1 Tax=Kovacikia minuta TaxID=2931930 RepID=UPI001CCD0D34|nr:hypothetical protein [Kovacikia minuta]UBF28595.1 hypothetical protein K9N68_12370 [Kovacikia minuta CCNUW1]